MRKSVVALAVILLALSALALAPGVVPTPYADILPKVIAGVAVLLLIAILADRSKAESARTRRKSRPPPSPLRRLQTKPTPKSSIFSPSCRKGVASSIF